MRRAHLSKELFGRDKSRKRYLSDINDYDTIAYIYLLFKRRHHEDHYTFTMCNEITNYGRDFSIDMWLFLHNTRHEINKHEVWQRINNIYQEILIESL